MPDKDGRFRGISVPRLPWLEDEPKQTPVKVAGVYKEVVRYGDAELKDGTLVDLAERG